MKAKLLVDEIESGTSIEIDFGDGNGIGVDVKSDDALALATALSCLADQIRDRANG